MVGVLDHVSKQGGRRVHVVEDNIDVAVVEKVSESRAASRDDHGEAAAGGGRNFLEFCAVEIAEKLRALGPGGAPLGAVGDRIDVAIGDENIEETVIVEVEEAGSPCEKWNRGVAEAGAEGNVGEISAAVVAVKGLVIVGEGGDEEVKLAVAIVIADADAHGSLCAAFFVNGEAAEVAYVLERAVVAVAVEIVRSGVVGDDQVQPAIVVEIGEDGSEAVATFAVSDARLQADVGERAIPIVVEEMIAFAEEAHGAAKNGDASVLAGAFGDAPFSGEDGALEIVFHVTGNEEIEQTVVVVVAPGWARGPTAESDTCLFGDVGERAVVVVVVKAVLAKVRDVDVRPSVVVIVGYCHAKPPALIRNAGLFGDVSEGAIVIVVEEHGARRSLLTLHCGERGTVEQVNVEPAIAVVIEKSGAGAGNIDNRRFFARARTMVKFIEAGLLCDVDENDRSAIHETTGGDGARQRILNGSVDSTGGHPGRPGGGGILRLLGGWLGGLLTESQACQDGGGEQEEHQRTAQHRTARERGRLHLGTAPASGSSTCRNWSQRTSLRVWRMPLGQRISIVCASDS